MASSTPTCHHSIVSFDPSPHATEAGYKFRTLQTRLNASLCRSPDVGKKDKDVLKRHDAFPAPLVLPDDELSFDPKAPGQSLSSWMKLDSRNVVTKKRNVLYVAAPPGVDDEVGFVRMWSDPVLNPTMTQEKKKRKKGGGKTKGGEVSSMKKGVGVPRPDTRDIQDYLSAFYHGLPVRPFPARLQYTSWDDEENTRSKTKAGTPQYIGLNTASEIVRIETRESPDGTFSHQLNLNDLLDAAIDMLPDDAYALLLIVDHDLFEDHDDDFACGRAYGGSRIAVVSSARYHPDLDQQQGVDRDHSWPASHCQTYINEQCCTATAATTLPPPPAKKARIQEQRTKSGSDSAMRAAVSAYSYLPPPTTAFHSSSKDITGLWLGRVCRTASHELGHCLGMDHCVYYACSMQGTASIVEDPRQPPYLCPVDLAKLVTLTQTQPQPQGGIEERYEALLRFCVRFPEVQLFAAYGAWIQERLGEIRDESISVLN